MEEQNIYFKQKNLFNPHENQQKVFVYGAGSIGSHVVVGLAKIGLRNIKVYDFDKVEADNLPAQFYPAELIETGLKTDELKKTVKFMTGTEIETENVKITEEFEPNKDFGSIHIIAFDNIEARKIIYEKLKGYPVHLIDGRIGGFNYEKYYLKMGEEVNLKEYEKTLAGNFAEAECGEKCLWAVNSLISAKIIADVIKLTKDNKPKFVHKGNLMSDITISGG